jgi:F0F1-type ATP synthase membrane subunit c/vacuolar-type H+-ATPase subunit K
VKKLNGKRKFYGLLGLFQLVLVLTVFLTVDGVITMVAAQTESFDYYNSPTAAVLAISAAIALAASVLGSAMAIRTVGTAAISSLSEREESFFKAFLIVALCEALAVYGLIVAILLWTKIPTPI